MQGNDSAQPGRLTGIVEAETHVEGGSRMKPTNPVTKRAEERNLLSEPESMQKYSDEVRERIAKKAYELYEQRGRQGDRDLEDWLKAEELVRKEMNSRRVGP